MFLNEQSQLDVQKYASSLSIVGSLSSLFSDSDVPFLHYRATENLFCLAFGAENLSRSDISFDALKDRVGIGIKTFLHNNGNTTQKVAEFNKDLNFYANRPAEEIIQIISELRNERISVAKRLYNTDGDIYHLITRKKAGFEIHEESMDLINIDRIRNIRDTNKGISFNDGLHEYNFNRSKSTLFKRFKTNNPLLFIPVTILEDPFSFLRQLDAGKRKEIIPQKAPEKQKVILPLYSPRDMEVQERSGLNQWNASGRRRDPNEIYIPVPRWIHRKFEGFFPYNPHTDDEGRPFDLILPDGEKISAKICQEGGKALMSNPNKVLGEWLLRRVLNLKNKELLTYDKLSDVGVDSVCITKETTTTFKIDFTSMGTYEEFSELNNGG
jgi:hypothetical protein